MPDLDQASGVKVYATLCFFLSDEFRRLFDSERVCVQAVVRCHSRHRLGVGIDWRRSGQERPFFVFVFGTCTVLVAGSACGSCS
jgi:hypothetical protein